MCNVIIRAITPQMNKVQHKRLVTFLSCLKTTRLTRDIISFLKNHLLAVLKEEHGEQACARQEICNIEQVEKKKLSSLRIPMY